MEESVDNGAAGARHGQGKWSLISTVLLLLAAAGTVAAFLVHETYSIDIWWQVAVGRDILNTHRVPTVDSYMLAALGRPYHDAHWLFQVLVALLDRIGGMAGVQLATIGIWVPTLLLCYRGARRWLAPWAAVILVFLTAMLSAERFLPRPEIVTFFMIAAFYVLLQEGRFRSLGSLAALALLQVLWTNSHGLFVIGPFLVGCYWLTAFADGMRGRESGLASLSKALGVVLLATLVTPHGFGTWRYAALLLTQVGPWAPKLFRDLGELTPVFGAAARSGIAVWFFAALLAVTAVSVGVAVHRRQRLFPRLLVVAALLAAGLSGRRNIVLFGLVAAPYAAECLGPAFRDRIARQARWAFIAALPMVALAWFPLSGRYYRALEIPASFGWGVTQSFFPHGLPAFLDRIEYRGRVLCSNTLGGFYLYHGYPHRLPLTTGCWVTVEPDLLDWIMAKSRHPTGWRLVMERFGLDAILLAHTSPEAAAMLRPLAGSSGWRLVYCDLSASFWMPVGATDLPPKVDLGDPGSLPPARSIHDAMILHAFLMRVGAVDLELINLRRLLALGCRDLRVLHRMGKLQLEGGQMDAAEKTFGLILEMDERDAKALNEMAFFVAQRGDLIGARRYLERALESEPGNKSVRQNYELIMRRLATRTASPSGSRP